MSDVRGGPTGATSPTRVLRGSFHVGAIVINKKNPHGRSGPVPRRPAASYGRGVSDEEGQLPSDEEGNPLGDEGKLLGDVRVWLESRERSRLAGEVSRWILYGIRKAQNSTPRLWSDYRFDGLSTEGDGVNPETRGVSARKPSPPTHQRHALLHYRQHLGERASAKIPHWISKRLLGLTESSGILRMDPPGGSQTALVYEHAEGAFVRAVSAGSKAVLQSYALREWDSPDLYAVMQCLLDVDRRYWVASLPRWLLGKARPEARLVKDASIHYDLPVEWFQAMTVDLSYSATSLRWAPGDVAAAQNAHFSRILEGLHLPASRGLILDLGCGWGSFMEYLRNSTRHSAIGITISTEQYEYARIRHGENVLLGDFLRRESWPENVDAVVLLESIEHIPPEQRLELLRDLRQRYPNARVAMQFTGRTFPKGAFRPPLSGAIFGLVFPGPGDMPSLRSMRKLASKAGYAVLSVRDLRSEYCLLMLSWLERHRKGALAHLDIGLHRMFEAYLAGSAAAMDKATVGSYLLLLGPKS